MRDWSTTAPNASFRGKEFFVEREALTGAGRKVALYEFAKSEDHDTDDMGRKVWHFRFEAYIVGDSADTDAQSFIAMCSTPGDGELVLPMFGSHTVKCTNCDGDAELHRQGFVRLSLEFLESGNGSVFAATALGDRIAASLMGGMAQAIGSTIASFAG